MLHTPLRVTDSYLPIRFEIERLVTEQVDLHFTGQAGMAHDKLADDPEIRDVVVTLGTFERRIFEMISVGRTTIQIAESLGRSVKAIEIYRARLKCRFSLARRDRRRNGQ